MSSGIAIQGLERLARALVNLVRGADPDKVAARAANLIKQAATRALRTRYRRERA
jgi:hypothetical protein